MPANTTQLQLSNLDFDTIKKNLIDYLKSQSQFQDYNFEGSAMNILLDVLSYNTFYNAFYMNMIANEMFLDSAVLRSSVISQAKSLGYTSRSAVAATATVNVTITKSGVDNTKSLNIPKFTKFASQALDGRSYSFYTTTDSAYVANVGSTFTFTNVSIKEGTPVVKQFGVDNSTNPTQIFDLVDANVDISTLSVIVQNSPTNPTFSVYTLAQDATQVSANSQVYYVQEGSSYNYSIYFGDGILGAKLPDKSIITVSYLVTNNELANGLTKFYLQSQLLPSATSTVTTVSQSGGGTQQESVDGIKYSAPKSFISQNRIVTKNDYITQINKNYPYFDAITVWGGEEQSPPVYGQVFISAKPKNGFVVTQDQQQYLINNILKPLSVLTVTPNYVPADYNYLNFNINLNYDPSKTFYTGQQLASLVANTVATFANSTLNTFNSAFKYSKFLSAIDLTDDSIESSSATIYLQKKLSPVINQIGSYTLNYGTPLHQGITSERIFSSPYFLSPDASGNMQQCYLEETPFSFGGIQAINVESPGYNYITAPRVIIQGDGLGANAYPVIVNGTVSSVVVDSAGNNYTTAAVTLVGGGGTGAVVIPTITGQNGILRSYYFDTNNVKQILNPNAGTIDYFSGIIKINNLYPTQIGGFEEVLSVFAQPSNYNFSSNNQIILTYDQTDPTAISIKTNVVKST